MSKNEKHKKATIAAIIFMLLFIASLGVQLWSSGKVYDYAGPDHIAENSNAIYVHANGEILVFSHTGSLLARYGKEITGITETPIDLRALPDGRILIALQRPARLILCDIQFTQCKPFANKLSDKLGSQYKVWWEDKINVVFSADFDSGNIYAYDVQYDSVRKMPLEEKLYGPNDIAIDDQLNIWVADSASRRIIRLAPSGNDSLKITASHKTSNDLSRPEQNYPMMMAEDDIGQWWVTQPTKLIGDEADVLIYDAEKGAQRRVSLPAGSFATDIVWANDRMLVTDMNNFNITEIQRDALVAKPFGDSAFYQLMEDARQQKQVYQQLALITKIGIGIFAILMIGAAFFAKPKDKQLTSKARMQDMNDKEIEANIKPVPAQTNSVQFKFNGKASEYFSIWIVNIGLTILTLGIYSAWAKVRNNQYFYGNTAVAESSFHYLADPIKILKGRIIAFVAFGAYYAASMASTMVAAIIFAVLMLLIPSFMVMSMSFRARNSAWRNVRFDFEKDYKRAYLYLAFPVIVFGLYMFASLMLQTAGEKPDMEKIRIVIAVMALGPLAILLFFPWWEYLINRFQLVNSRYGRLGFSFSAGPKDYYKIYITAAIVISAVGILISVIIAAIAAGTMATDGDAEPKEILAKILPYAGFSMLIFIPIYMWVFAFINARKTNLVLNSISIGSHGLNSELKVGYMMYLYFTNTLAITLSLGLLVPWAKVRTARYRASRTQLLANGDLNDIVAGEHKAQSALGEEMGEMFDLDIGM